MGESSILPEACPHCYEQIRNTAKVIYGYTDDGDKELNARDGKDLYLAGCVPDSYGINLKTPITGELNWYYPMNYCNRCGKFFNYVTMDEALMVTP
jgi:hypothetical protein